MEVLQYMLNSMVTLTSWTLWSLVMSCGFIDTTQKEKNNSTVEIFIISEGKKSLQVDRYVIMRFIPIMRFSWFLWVSLHELHHELVYTRRLKVSHWVLPGCSFDLCGTRDQICVLLKKLATTVQLISGFSVSCTTWMSFWWHVVRDTRSVRLTTATTTTTKMTTE